MYQLFRLLWLAKSSSKSIDSSVESAVDHVLSNLLGLGTRVTLKIGQVYGDLASLV